MTTIIFKSDELINEIELNGHSGYATKGSDIVCSAITTVTFSTINLLDKINQKFNLEQNEQTGFLRLCLDYQLSDEQTKKLVQVILKNLFDTYEVISSDYPKYVKLISLGGCHD